MKLSRMSKHKTSQNHHLEVKPSAENVKNQEGELSEKGGKGVCEKSRDEGRRELRGEKETETLWPQH